MSRLIVLRQRAAVCRLEPGFDIPSWVQIGDITAIIRTPEEISIICDENSVPGNILVENGWRIIKVQGPLDFSQIGVLAAIAVPLAQAGVSIFTISTFNTDYILVKESFLALAINALQKAGHSVEVA